MRHAVCHAPAPSIRAASSRSGEMLFSAPYITTIQPPAPVQNAMRVNRIGRCEGSMTWPNVSKPNARSRKLTGLTAGSSRNSQTMTLAAPASAPGM